MGAPSFDARELDYELPEQCIAQAPLPERDAARLLCTPRGELSARHAQVRDLPELLAPSLLVLNDTRVMPARLLGQRPSGGRVELLLVERVGPPGVRERWRSLGRANKSLRPGDLLRFGDVGAVIEAEVESCQGRELEVTLQAEGGVEQALASVGRVPLPPYIRRDADSEDARRYQTVYAREQGAVAAPTAGLHFTPELLERIEHAGHRIARVTLHVGPGTFAPLRSDDLADHEMHPERFEVPDATVEAIAAARREGRRVLAVGTTVVRALEAAADPNGAVRAGPASTSIFIYPPYRFRVVEALMTNFHLPRSTLLALVMALGGIEAMRGAYREAIDRGYRFYSYGDAMLIGGTP